MYYNYFIIEQTVNWDLIDKEKIRYLNCFTILSERYYKILFILRINLILRLWNQLESEIYLHRHKTIIKACRGKRLLTQKSNKVESNLFKESSNSELNSNYPIYSEILSGKECKEVNETKKESSRDDLDLFRKNHDLTEIRSVLLSRKDSKEGLGISITGGNM